MNPKMDKACLSMKRIVTKVKAFLLNKKQPKFYAVEGKALLEAEQGRQAKQILDKGVSFYPNSLLIHRQYALFMMENKMWKEAVTHWDKVFDSPNGHLLYEEDYQKASQAYLKLESVKKSVSVLKLGFSKHPNNLNIIQSLAESLMLAKKWEDASLILMLFFEKEKKEIPASIYLSLATAYQHLNVLDKADYLIREAVIAYPTHKQLAHRYAEIAVKRKEWQIAIERFNYVIELYDSHESVLTEILLSLSMLYQLTGEYDTANNLMERLHVKEIEKNPEAYNKMRLFENEGSTIDFYKKFKRNNQVIITFDSRDVDWREPPFGFKLLLRQDVDIIAVRQKEIKTYQQSLSQEEFLRTVETIVAGYGDKIAYGHSLGGYSALYFGSDLNCRILALAPRISAHPIFGTPEVIAKQKFNHHLTHNYNKTIEPIIVYDPKQRMDHRYVTEALLPAYPNAIITKLPYSGHGVARHLLRTGMLKDFILTVIDGRIPTYNRALKGKSSNYCRVLGKECLRRGKLKWAKDLSDRCLELSPGDRYGVKLKLEVLDATRGQEAALSYIKEEVRKFPRRLMYRVILIDYYIKLEDLLKAEVEVQQTLHEFKTKELLWQRQEKIARRRKIIIKQPLKISNESESNEHI